MSVKRYFTEQLKSGNFIINQNLFHLFNRVETISEQLRVLSTRPG